MIGFLLRKLLAGLLTLWVVMSLTFVLIRFLPGGPFQDPKVPPAIQRMLESKYLLNEPLWVQYGHYLGQLLHGDLGPSLTSESRMVADILIPAAGYSALIGIPALLLGICLGGTLGLLAAVSKRSSTDGLLSLFGMGAISLPTFVFGGTLILIFALTLNWLPAATVETPRHLVLPILTLSLSPFAYGFLMIRSAAQEIKGELFVRIKRSFGVPEETVQWRHIFRLAILPLISILGPMTAALVTGSFAVEYMFAIPGLGKYFVSSVLNRDYTVVMGVTLLFGVVLIVLNTLTDILYGMLDPRLREEPS